MIFNRVFAAFLAGALFALGLALSGMTQPIKVLGFLDFTGAWDPTLLVVMFGAVLVHLVSFRLITRRRSPLLSPQFDVPTVSAIDRRLIAGCAIFGIGWGLSGYCPGPAIVSLGTGLGAPFYFGGGLLGGVLIYDSILRQRVFD